MRFGSMRALAWCVLCMALAAAAPSHAQDAAADNMRILRDKIKADKKLVVAANMDLTDSESKAFWPAYDAYQKDLEQINQQILGTIKSYAAAYKRGPIAADTAKKLVAEALAAEEAELKLKRAYVPRLEKALPAAKVARYLQIENKIRALLRYELAAEIPLVP